MNRETIEKAARNFIEDFCHDHIDYTSINYEEDNYEAARNNTLWEFGTEIFMAGAEWRINSVWHNLGKEMPECNRHVVNEDWFDFIAKDEKDLARIIKKYPFKQWAYVDDLLPERKEEEK